jgi:hypothetical protein
MSGAGEVIFRQQARRAAALLDEALRWRAIMRNHACGQAARDEATAAYVRAVDALVEDLARLRDAGAIHRLLRRLRDDG